MTENEKGRWHWRQESGGITGQEWVLVNPRGGDEMTIFNATFTDHVKIDEARRVTIAALLNGELVPPADAALPKQQPATHEFATVIYEGHVSAGTSKYQHIKDVGLGGLRLLFDATDDLLAPKGAFYRITVSQVTTGWEQWRKNVCKAYKAKPRRVLINTPHPNRPSALTDADILAMPRGEISG
jgi:hypothetical protein